MFKNSRFRFIVFAFLFAAIIAASVVFTSNVLADTKSVVKFKVENDSQFPFIIFMYGEEQGREYSMTVPAYSKDKVFVVPDTYSYLMEACNYAKNGTFDLSVFQTLHVPVCGGKAAGYRNKSHHIDVSRLVKPVRSKIRNQTGETVELYLRTVDDHHFLTLDAGEIMEVILKKEEGIQYVYSFVACDGQLVTGYYTPRVTPPLDLKCP